MAEDSASQASGSLAAVVSTEDKSAKQRRYYAERDVTKMYLFEQYKPWRNLMAELPLKSDKNARPN